MPDSITVRRVIPAPPEELFDAWLDAKSLSQWMRAGRELTCTAKTDARVGGKFEIIMHGETEDFPHTGEYRVIERPTRLVFTWHSKATQQRESIVTVEFHRRGNQTEVVLTHTGLPADVADDHKKGWTEILNNLAAVNVR